MLHVVTYGINKVKRIANHWRNDAANQDYAHELVSISTVTVFSDGLPKSTHFRRCHFFLENPESLEPPSRLSVKKMTDKNNNANKNGFW